ncbi:MAG: PepSY domain-containing protein [Massilia sp.]
MKTVYTKLLIAAVLAGAAATASAHGDVKCKAYPKSEWKSHEELAKKLEADGWVIRRMEVTKTCYEVYAKDPQGKRVEAFFDPVTFARVEE